MRRKASATGNRAQRTAIFVLILVAVASGLVLAPVALYQYSYIGYDQFFFAANACVSLSFLVSALIYSRFVSPGRRGVLRGLGLGRDGLTWRNLALGLVIFAMVVMLELIVSLIGQVANVQIDTNVSVVFAAAPLWFLAFSAVASPVCEEVMFRGLMVPRLGIVISALIFAALHASYNSTFGIEVIAALIFGLIAGYVFKRTKSLYPSILAHVLVNTLTVLVTFVPGV